MAIKYPKMLLGRFPKIAEKQKPTLYVGDSFAVIYEVRQFDPANKLRPEGTPTDPLTAFVRCKNDASDDLFLLDGTNEEVAMLIEPSTSEYGAFLTYTLPSVFTDTPGNYELFITATFSDGDVVTQNRRFTVRPLIA